MKQKQWTDSCSGQMSDVYCRVCEHDKYDSPAILMDMAHSHTNRHPETYQNVLNADSEPDILSTTVEATCVDIEQNELNSERADEPFCDENLDKANEYEMGNDVAACDDEKLNNVTIQSDIDMNQMIRVRGKEELPVSTAETQNAAYLVSDAVKQSPTTINGNSIQKSAKDPTKQMPMKTICDVDDHPLAIKRQDSDGNDSNADSSTNQLESDALNRNHANGRTSSHVPSEKMSVFKRMHRMYSTLPKIRKPSNRMAPMTVPTRVTPDGTTIYYFCNLTKQPNKGAHHISQFVYNIDIAN